MRPNVVVVVLDDTGFAQLGCYGSDIATPAIDGLAARGVRLTDFHTTAICSPTRACLLTGRNHHRVGMGMLPDLPMAFPGYTAHLPDEAATLAQVLAGEGYATFAVGKWHLTPRDQRSPSGPFGTWPLAKGFEHFYGFLGGDANHWAPELVRDQTYVDPPRTPDEGYHLTEDLADEAIARVRELRRNQPDRPFFLWLALGATHAPHHVAPEWSDPYRGRFDGGWDEWRRETLERQIRLGVVAPGTELPTGADHVADWDGLDERERRLYARMMEVYAGFLTHADAQIGRVLAALDALGEPRRHHRGARLGQRGLRRGRAARLGERVPVRPGSRRGPRAEPATDRRAGRAAHLQPLPLGLGRGRQHPGAALQAVHVRGRRARPRHRVLARRARRGRRDPPPVLPRRRRLPHHPRPRRGGRAPTSWPGSSR